MSLRDVQTIHVTNMLARDSVILLLSAIDRFHCHAIKKINRKPFSG